MKKILLYVLLGLSTTSSADVLGFSIGAQYWHYDLEGKVRSPIAGDGQVRIDFTNNSDLNPYLVFEHPVPILPNFKLQQNNIQAQGLIPVSDPSFLDGQEVLVAGDINFNHTDLVLYYEVLDNWVNFDLGVSVKYFDGYQRYKYQNQINDELDFDHLIPMLYAKGQFNMPLTGLSAMATVRALSLDSNKVTEVELGLRYEYKLGLAADLGYRNLDIDLEKINDFKSDMTVDGFFLGLSFNF